MLGDYVAERLDPSVDVESHTVLVAALVRGGDALSPSVIVPRPALELAAHYVPMQDGVGGDFYLAVEAPRGSTVLVVGDVVGKGIGAAQRAVFVRYTDGIVDARERARRAVRRGPAERARRRR